MLVGLEYLGDILSASTFRPLLDFCLSYYTRFLAYWLSLHPEFHPELRETSQLGKYWSLEDPLARPLLETIQWKELR